MAWPVEIDGRAYQPIPESWIEHGVDVNSGEPRLYAVSVAHDADADLLRVRYAHPKTGNILEATTGACEGDDGIIPCAMASRTGNWPRSLVPTRDEEPVGMTRRPEPAYLRELWADRVAAIKADPAVADGGVRRATDALGDVRQLHFSDYRWHGGGDGD